MNLLNGESYSENEFKLAVSLSCISLCAKSKLEHKSNPAVCVCMHAKEMYRYTCATTARDITLLSLPAQDRTHCSGLTLSFKFRLSSETL